MRKSLMFGKKPWIITFGKSRWLALFKTLFFWSKNHSFLSKISKNHLFWLNYTKKPEREENRFLNNNRGLSLYENVHFFRPFTSLVFWCIIYSFLFRIPRNDLFEHNFFKNANEKKFEFWEKPWTILEGKGRVFGAPQNVTFLV